jgi:hypothetical protein
MLMKHTSGYTSQFHQQKPEANKVNCHLYHTLPIWTHKKHDKITVTVKLLNATRNTLSSHLP